MKTPEEIKAAVLKECERLTIDGHEKIAPGMFLFESKDSFDLQIRRNGNHTDHWKLLKEGKNEESVIHLFYRLLNLEAKEIQERAQGLIAFTEAMQTEFRDGKYGYMARQALNQWKGGGNV